MLGSKFLVVSNTWLAYGERQRLLVKQDSRRQWTFLYLGEVSQSDCTSCTVRLGGPQFKLTPICLFFHQAIAIEIKHDDKLPEEGQAYFQCALLYTSISGQRRLRIHNLAFSTCSQLSDLFRCCEMDTFVNVVSKQGKLYSACAILLLLFNAEGLCWRHMVSCILIFRSLDKFQYYFQTH